MGLKLWYCWALMDDEGVDDYVVAPDENSALQKWRARLDAYDDWYCNEMVTEATEIDGYKVVFLDGEQIGLVSQGG